MGEPDTEERRKPAEQGKAMPSGAFPIRNREDLQDAIRSYGRAKDKDVAKRWITETARLALMAAPLGPICSRRLRT